MFLPELAFKGMQPFLVDIDNTFGAIDSFLDTKILIINITCKNLDSFHQCSPINCARGTNLATRELIKHCKDIPVIIAF